MKVGGFQKFSLVDYPGKDCAIIFTQGCDFRRQYCYNPELVIPERYSDEIPVSEIFDFLKKRRQMLDAVVITGGEPTLHNDLSEFLREVKDLGYLVKLDTNGTNPDVLERLIEENLLDYLAMDIKAPLDDYDRVVGAPVSLDKIKRSIEVIMGSEKEYEFRTTVVNSLLKREDIIKIASLIKGAEKYYLQRFMETEESIFGMKAGDDYSEEELEEIANEAENFVKNCKIR